MPANEAQLSVSSVECIVVGVVPHLKALAFAREQPQPNRDEHGEFHGSKLNALEDHDFLSVN